MQMFSTVVSLLDNLSHHLQIGRHGVLYNNNNNNNNNKVDVQFPHILVRKLHTQACEIVGETKRKLCE